MAKGTESRIPPILTLLLVLVLLVLLPQRFFFLPPTLMYALCGVAIAAMVAAGVAPVGSVWASIERWVIVFFICFGIFGELVVLKDLVADIIFHIRSLNPITLLATAIALWVGNVLLFALVYWQLDRGGPDGRARGWNGWADLSFPQGHEGDGMPVGWSPSFLDYLYVAFDTSTAFSACDTSPLRTRVKLLFMAQSAISLVTLVIVAARAINILA